MERFLQRTGYAGDQILVSFARMIEEPFFKEGKDVLVNDESMEYRASLIAAMVGSFLEGAKNAAQSEKGRVLILAEHEKTLSALSQLFGEMHIDDTMIVSKEETPQAEGSLCDKKVVVIPAESFLTMADSGCVKPREFGFLVIEGADAFSEKPGEVQRKIWGYLLPPWERRAALFAERVGIRTKNTAIDFADNPKIIVLKKAQASLNAIATSMYRVSSEQKFKVLLSLIAKEKQNGHSALVVFCNLRQTSKEVAARLRLNHIQAEHLSSAAPKSKNEDLLRHFSESGTQDGGESFVLVVSNDNLEALPAECTALAIHYDIPLDADVYLDRVRAMRDHDATMVGLVCERYEVGLSAIKARFGVQCEVEEPDAAMLACRDESEGVTLQLEREHVAEAPSPMRRQENRGQEARANDHRSRDRESFRRSHSQHHGGGRAQGGRGQPVSSAPKAVDHALYSMNTEERLAYFRNKYKNILTTPSQPSSPMPPPPSKSEEKPKVDESAPQDSRTGEEGGIVKRFIGKFLSGNRDSEPEKGNE